MKQLLVCILWPHVYVPRHFVSLILVTGSTRRIISLFYIFSTSIAINFFSSALAYAKPNIKCTPNSLVEGKNKTGV